MLPILNDLIRNIRDVVSKRSSVYARRCCALVAGMLSLCFIVGMSFPDCSYSLTIYGVDEPPGSYLAANGTIIGISIDVVQELQRRVGDTTPIIFMPETRVLSAATKHDDVLFFSFSRTPERENSFRWLMPVFRKTWVLYMKKELARKDYSFDELRRMHVGVKLGDVRETYLKQSGFSHIESVITHTANIQKLKSGRIDAMLYDTPGMTFDCKELGENPLDFRGVFTPAASDVYIIFSKHIDDRTFATWRSAVENMVKDGTYRRIAEDWAKKLYEIGIETEITDDLLILH